jgi:hypothetical protein
VARKPAGEKAAAKIFVLNKVVSGTYLEALEELRIKAITSKSQANLQQSEQRKWQQNELETKKPAPPHGERLDGTPAVAAWRLVSRGSTAQQLH